MDSRRFDALAKSLSSTDTRRGIARLLAVLPLGVALTALLGDERDTTAKDDDHGSSHRRHRRKAKHRHQTGNDKENRKGKRKGCTPRSDAKTCVGKCGTVRNNCGKRVDCGACTCATGCPQCQTCNPATGQCDPIANGTSCNDGNVCTTGDSCQSGVCQGTPVACSDPATCCPAGTPKAGTCARVSGTGSCSSDAECCSGNCGNASGCCPVCPSGCICGSTEGRRLCTDATGSFASCGGASVPCTNPAEACFGGQCLRVCESVG